MLFRSPYSEPPADRSEKDEVTKPQLSRLKLTDVSQASGLACRVVRPEWNEEGGQYPSIEVVSDSTLQDGAAMIVNVSIVYAHEKTNAEGIAETVEYIRDCPIELKAAVPPEPVYSEADKAYLIDFAALQDGLGIIASVKAEVAVQPLQPNMRFTSAVKDGVISLYPAYSGDREQWIIEGHPLTEMALKVELDMENGQKHNLYLPLRPKGQGEEAAEPDPEAGE